MKRRAIKSGPFARMFSPYQRAMRLVEQGNSKAARAILEELKSSFTETQSDKLLINDLTALEALDGKPIVNTSMFFDALHADGNCAPARLNTALLTVDLGEPIRELVRVLAPPLVRLPAARGPARVVIASLLFNWPSTGGGNVHTVELGRFLGQAGYEVQHIFARYPAWGIGNVEAPLSIPSEALVFDDPDWNVPEIQRRFRQAVETFDPDCVIVTDCWNMKPLLAEAVHGYPYFLRFQALECLCPLNNLRLLADGPDEVRQCSRNQLATPKMCRACVDGRGHHSGPLHQLERALAGAGHPKYERRLMNTLGNAEAVLVLNPLTQAMLNPYASVVEVVPWGMDPARFPWPVPEAKGQGSRNGAVRLFMASVNGEFIKGFHVARQACEILCQTRDDFELVVTFDPPGRIDVFTRSVGWLSQEDLPRQYRESDICLVPTIAQEGLSRTSVEAMASGIPVIASRIGGLPYTVTDGLTGLLFEPGDAADLARKIERLLDDPELRRQMGLAGRWRFDKDFRWDVVIERYYRPLIERAISHTRARHR
jgi:glycosyltransferase involved in cell wall biosynthesis